MLELAFVGFNKTEQQYFGFICLGIRDFRSPFLWTAVGSLLILFGALLFNRDEKMIGFCTDHLLVHRGDL